jgi:dienelactone hydrolase
MPPIGYNKAADEKSWQDMQAFFNEIFGSAAPKPQ